LKVCVFPAAEPSGARPTKFFSIVRSRARMKIPSRAARRFVTPVPAPVSDSPRIVTPCPPSTVSPWPSSWTASCNGRAPQSAPGCVHPSIVVASRLIVGSAVAGAITCGPAPGIANAIVFGVPCNVAFTSVSA
jgi:hypothetical protein